MPIGYQIEEVHPLTSMIACPRAATTTSQYGLFLHNTTRSNCATFLPAGVTKELEENE